MAASKGPERKAKNICLCDAHRQPLSYLNAGSLHDLVHDMWLMICHEQPCTRSCSEPEFEYILYEHNENSKFTIAPTSLSSTGHRVSPV